MSKLICSICSTETVGKFCHNCGQENSNKRLKITDIIGGLFSDLLSLEKSGVATMMHILKSPKRVIEHYWDGKRRYFQPPSKLILYASLVVGLHTLWHSNRIMGLAYGDTPQSGFLILFLVLFPLSSYLTYIKRKKNLIEHIVANFYLFCTWSIVFIGVYDLLFLIIGLHDEVSYVFILLLIGVMLFYNATVFVEKSTIKRKILYALGQLLFLILILTCLFGSLMLSGQLELTY